MAKPNQDMIRFRAILEVLGRPKEHVENTIKTLVAKAKERHDVSVINEKFADIREEGKLFSTFVELEIVEKGKNNLSAFCFDFMPSSIEVDKPDQVILRNADLSDVYNDLQAKLHTVDMIAKKLNAENDFLRRNLGTMISNLLTVLIKIGKNSLNDLSKFTGINEKELADYIKKLEQEGKIKKEGDIFQLV